MKTVSHRGLRITLTRLVALLVILTLLPTGVSLADSGARPEPAAPVEQMSPTDGEVTSQSLMATISLMNGDVFQRGADRLAALQNTDGGWGWPTTGITAPNIIQPTAQGLAAAYLHTGDADHLAALTNAGVFLLTKTNNFSPGDGYLAATLDDIFGGTTYTDYVKTHFYDLLDTGAYNRNGTLYDTAGYVNLIRTARAAQGIGNLAAWDIAMGLVGAAAVGANTGPWVAGVEAEINELNGSAYYDVLGLAGAVYGLAYVGEDFDPTAGQHEAASSLDDLGAILAGYQLASGGFTWNSWYMGEGQGNESIQETAYAILALDKLNRTLYLSDIQAAADYIESVQLGTGGWENYAGDGENNELTGEALWAVHTAYSNVFTGFLQPIDVSLLNTAKAGQTIPVKWRLLDVNGLPISDPSSFVNLITNVGSCSTGEPTDAIESYSGASGLQYLGDGYWQYNWKTPKNYAGKCRTMYIQFDGGMTSPVVDFQFK